MVNLTPFKDYLRDNAHFYCPPTADESNTISCTTAEESDAAQLQYEWKPTEARRDPYLVDSLINVLDTFLGERDVPSELVGRFEHFLNLDTKRDNVVRSVIRSEPDVIRLLLTRPLNMLDENMAALDQHISIDNDVRPRDYKSTADFSISAQNGRKVLVGARSPNVFNETEATYFVPSISGFRVNLDQPAQSGGEKLLNNACLYMGSHEVQWLALTCYTKWVFFRLHCSEKHNQPYITYSSVEEQKNNTKPFRALLGMMLAVAMDINVLSNVDMQAQLVEVPEEEIPTLRRQQGPSSGKDRNRQTKWERRPARSLINQEPSESLLSGFFVAWSKEVNPDDSWLEFHAVETRGFPSLGKGTIKLRIQRSIGEGSTGDVYEAIPEGDEQTGLSRRRRYAIKAAPKGVTTEEKSALLRLFDEVAIYREIEQRWPISFPQSERVVPQCYGLFETDQTLALVMDYEGDTLSLNGDWPELTPEERHRLYNAISTLHKLGVYHWDLEPCNVLRSSDGSFKIIDFTLSRMHNCNVYSDIFTHDGDDKLPCDQLRLMAELLGERIEYRTNE